MSMLRKLFKREKSVDQIVAAIHNEFDTATERLLNEAKAILSKGANTSKAEDLRSLGFVNAKPVKDSREAEEERRFSALIAEKVQYFLQWYPHNKFITEAEVKRICEKYGLLYGPVQNYIGDVPEKNVDEMKAFVLREDDKHKVTRMHQELEWRWRMGLSGMSNLGRLGYSRNSFEENMPTFETIYKQPSFVICAPEKDFDTRNMRKHGYKLIPDPIVLQPVDGGYLIVTKWGPEASDELVVNKKMN